MMPSIKIFKNIIIIGNLNVVKPNERVVKCSEAKMGEV
jgi:hypothetical protein